MNAALIELARAKVNLSLHVTGLSSEGYHLLDSIVAFADFGDALSFKPSQSLKLRIDGLFGDRLEASEDNLVLRAAKLMASPAVDVKLTKLLPVASGIGGGSADAAATLRGISRLMGGNLPSTQDQLSLGADVPVCVESRACRMGGIGEVLCPVDLAHPLYAVLVNPNLAVSTAAVFGALKEKNNSGLEISGEISLEMLKEMRNDLQEPAISICPEIKNVLSELKAAGAELYRMSGSGATCFGLFAHPEAAETAAQSLAARHPKWWVKSGTLS